MSTEGVAAASGIELRWREAGAGDPLVLVHGFPVDGRVFDGQLAAAGAGTLRARLVCPDLPGFGATPLPHPAPEVLEIEVLAEGLADLLRHLAARPAVVGGVAIGGYIAIELAARHPEAVRGLVLMGNRAAPDSPAMAPKREEVARLALDAGSAAVADELASQPLGPDASADVRERVRSMIVAADPLGIAALVRGLARRPDPTPALEGLRVPVLVIGGSLDPFTPPAEATRLTGLIPGARLVELTGVGHHAPLEAPDRVTAAINAFMASVP
ncbi:MAG: alpha/beta fold hydrolase [Candidatus Limnocylindrales bacterium]